MKKRWTVLCSLPVCTFCILSLVLTAVCCVFLFKSGAETAITISIAAAGIIISLAAVFATAFVVSRLVGKLSNEINEVNDFAGRISEGSHGIKFEGSAGELRELTDSLNCISDDIARSTKLQSEFISSVSHELRTPLTAITGWSEILADDEAIQGDSRRGVEIISKEAGRLTKMVSELLEFTRIQDGRFTLNVGRINAGEVLEECVFTYSELLRQDHINLQYTPYEGELPEINGDGERLKQVFLNLIDNAAKHGKDGGRIQVELTADENSISIHIRDFGSGISEADLPHVKEKFYKGGGKERGSGIGLAVCDEIITRHRGSLSIENAPEGGVIATVTLPIN